MCGGDCGSHCLLRYTHRFTLNMVDVVLLNQFSYFTWTRTQLLVVVIGTR